MDKPVVKQPETCSVSKPKSKVSWRGWAVLVAIVVVVGYFMPTSPNFVPTSPHARLLKSLMKWAAPEPRKPFDPAEIETRTMREQANRAEYDGRNEEARRLREVAERKEKDAKAYAKWKQENGK